MTNQATDRARHLNLPIDPKIHKRLKLLSVEQDRPVSEIVREAIGNYLNKMEK